MDRINELKKRSLITHLFVGGEYNWKHAPEHPLIYIGASNGWHCFAKVEDPEEVWCEVRPENIHMIEGTMFDN